MRKIIKLIITNIIVGSLLYAGCGSHPEITESMIQENIEEKATDEGLASWKFAKNEPRFISVLETKCDDDKATVVIDMKTFSSGYSEQEMAGMLRLNYEWIVNDWFITKIENLSFKQKKWRKRKVQNRQPQTLVEFAKLGHKYLSQKNYIKAEPYLDKACTHGHILSCNYLAYLYLKGKGLEKDLVKAKDLYTKSCNGDHMPSCNNLAYMYKIGDGVEKNLVKAIDLYTKACNEDNMPSCSQLASMYKLGEGVEKNEDKTVELLTKSCDGGHADSCNSLGVIYTTGVAVDKDTKKANKLYLKACNNNVIKACFNLGISYMGEFGVNRNLELAKQYLNKACKKGYQKSCKWHKSASSKAVSRRAIKEIDDLKKLKEISVSNDVTIAYWNNYGESISKISETLVLGNEKNHHEGDYVVSKILLSPSQQEVKDLMKSVVLEHIDTEKKINDIYLYLPSRIIRGFSTSKLTTLASDRKIELYSTTVSDNTNGIIKLKNKMEFDPKGGKVDLGFKKGDVKYLISTENTKDNKVKLDSKLYSTNGEYVVVYSKSHGDFFIMDVETFNSTYVQMFILGKYDKELFELVVLSPYSKIYRFKK